MNAVNGANHDMLGHPEQPIYVTKTFLPPREEFDEYVGRIWQTNQLTNNGPLTKEFEERVTEHLDLEKQRFRFIANGTLALQLALRALDITEGEVITTPFTYVATTSAILWERCVPVYVDIDPETLNIDPSKIEAAITTKTKAIMPVHVFGNPCEIDAIQEIADRHGLKVIYDAAHAFGVNYKGKSLVSYGDVSICSFHATKLFHTIEGGAIYAKDKTVIEKAELLKRFGHNGDEHIQLGINAKPTEFNAAMGLCNLKYVDNLIEKRHQKTRLYDELLKGAVRQPSLSEDISQYNYGYYPVIFKSEKELLKVLSKLDANKIFPRRYFYPSLNKLDYISNAAECPVSEDVSRRVACLPLFADLADSDISRIAKIICQAVDEA